jgi:hypothetical protein
MSSQIVKVRLVGPPGAVASLVALLKLWAAAQNVSRPRPSKYDRTQILQYLDIVIEDRTDGREFKTDSG